MIILPAFYAQLQVQVTMWSDPYTREPLEGDEKMNEFKSSEILNMTIIVTYIITHSYLIQRDLIMAVIDKHMTSKIQTQM